MEEKIISAYDILIRHCPTIKHDPRIGYILLAMGDYTLQKLKQERKEREERQKPNIKYVGNAKHPDTEFQG